MKNHETIEAIVFDLGGVLIDWNPRYLYRKLFAHDSEGMERFLTEVCNQAWNEQQDAGRTFAEAVRELSQRYPHWQPMIEAYHTRWSEMLNGAIEGTVEILANLKTDGWALHALTNWSAETFPCAREQFKFLSWFDSIVVSGVEKMKKPDPRFFQLLLDRNDLKASSCLFIDDVHHNIKSAADLGFHTHHFSAPEALRADLKERGILR
jgi:2-haloacid dehalogenase